MVALTCILCGKEITICGICNTNTCQGAVCIPHTPIIAKILRGHGATVSLQ